MNRVISDDGTSIAFERFGEGRPVILVGGAICDRAVTRPRYSRRCWRSFSTAGNQRGAFDA